MTSNISISYSLILIITIPMIVGLTIAFEIFHMSGVSWVPFKLAHGESAGLTNTSTTGERPTMNEEKIKTTVVVEGLKHPTSMTFLGPDDFLVLEKRSGIVKRVVNGNILNTPVLDVNVANEKERGMLGVASSIHNYVSQDAAQNLIGERLARNLTYVFLFFTESSGKEGNDDCPFINYCKIGTEPLGNRLYRYEYRNGSLNNPKLLLDLPANPGSDHLGGAILVGPDDNVYVTTGDGDSCSYNSCDNGIESTVLNSQSANVKKGEVPNGRGGILRVTQNGSTVTGNTDGGILSKDGILSKYYAYGIRNSYGIDFDPISGKLWDTENGPSFGDEINLVEPGFNSGWLKVQGIWSIHNRTQLYPQGVVPPYRGYFEGIYNKITNDNIIDLSDLVDFQGRGKYSDPEFIWNMTVGVTAIKFFHSDKLGEEYRDDLFVADSNLGNIYHFDLNTNRTELEFHGAIVDRMVHSLERAELDPILFGQGFGSVTDLEVGPDGYLYVVSYNKGKIFKIVPDDDSAEQRN